MAEYNKKEVLDVGDAIYNLVKGFGDGMGAEEIGNLTNVLIEAGQASNELKTNTAASGCHIGGRLMDKFGDDLVKPEVDPA